MELTEIQSLDLHEIIEHKAKEAYKHIEAPVLVEDTSLTFHALGKLPGPLIKWFLAELDNEGLCKILNGYKDRSALAEVCFGFYDGKELKIFEGQREGSIATEPKGERGFGWDPIFIPHGYTKTWGEMDMEEQKETSIWWKMSRKARRPRNRRRRPTKAPSARSVLVRGDTKGVLNTEHS